MENHQADSAERGSFWLPPGTTGWELVPGPHACWCGMPACRSGWEWRPTAATSEAAPGGATKTPDTQQAMAGLATEPGAREADLSGPQPARQDPVTRQPGVAELEREA